MYKFLGRLTARHPWAVCGAWVLVLAGLPLLAPSWDANAQDDDIHFLPDRCDSVRGYVLLARAFPEDVFASRLMLAVERPGAKLSEADLALTRALVAELEDLRARDPALQMGKIYSYRDPFIGRRLLSEDGTCTLIQVSLGSPFLALQTRQSVDRIEERMRAKLAAAPDAPRLFVTGPAGIGRDLISASAKGLDGTTWATVALVLLILLMVYRAPLLALVPLVTIAVSVAVAMRLLACMTLIPGIHLVQISKVFAIVILYGAGTDYCLFLISRYREELSEGHLSGEAVQRSVRAVGGALAASAGTVICGLGMMIFAEFAKVRCAGPAIALSLTVALVGSLTLAPALLAIMGRVVFWPFSVVVNPTRSARLAARMAGEPRWSLNRLWDRLARVVIVRPLTVFLASLGVLAPLALISLRVAPAYRPTGELSASADSVRGLDAIQHHFTAGEIGPITVLLTASGDWSGPTGRRVIEHLCEGFCRLDNVSEVRSLTRPLGTPMLPAFPKIQTTPKVQTAGLFGSLLRTVQDNVGGLLERTQQAARSHYVAELSGTDGPVHVTRLDVVMKSDPFNAASMETLELVQTWLRTELGHATRQFGPVQAETYGVTVNARDLATITEADRTRINGLVLGGIFLILLALVRQPWLAAYLLGTVLLSYAAALGMTALVSWLWLGRPLGQVDWRVPFFLFTILVAVGEDYNILLITRMLQENRRFGATKGTERALARTGGTISACGLIMAGTFATLMLSGLNTLVQVGFALAFGVLLDTFVVRPFLVPSFAVLVWRGLEAETARPAPRLPARRYRRAG